MPKPLHPLANSLKTHSANAFNYWAEKRKKAARTTTRTITIRQQEPILDLKIELKRTKSKLREVRGLYLKSAAELEGQYADYLVSEARAAASADYIDGVEKSMLKLDFANTLLKDSNSTLMEGCEELKSDNTRLEEELVEQEQCHTDTYSDLNTEIEALENDLKIANTNRHIQNKNLLEAKTENLRITGDKNNLQDLINDFRADANRENGFLANFSASRDLYAENPKSDFPRWSTAEILSKAQSETKKLGDLNTDLKGAIENIKTKAKKRYDADRITILNLRREAAKNRQTAGEYPNPDQIHNLEIAIPTLPSYRLPADI